MLLPSNTLANVGAAESGNESPMRSEENGSGWMLNWWGLVPVLLVAITAIVGWRWLDGNSAGSNDGDDSLQIGEAPTTSSADSSAGSSAPEPSTTTTMPLTPVLPSTTSVAPDRQVLITGEMKPCKFGANCLVASFTIMGFDELPDRYLCIYPNSRRDFGLTNDRIDDACLTADRGDTITIEVDGVSSATISEAQLDGAEPIP
jgi:hypothetical protein